MEKKLIHKYFIFRIFAENLSKTSAKINFQSQNSLQKNVFIPATVSLYSINDKKNDIRVDEDCEEKTIGFVAEWINAYIFLESKFTWN